MGELLSIFLLSLLAMFNPTLLAAVTVMMLLPNPKTLMFGYLMGAYVTSISVGMLIVFSLDGSESVSTAKRTLSPIEDIVVGLIALLVAYVLAGSRAEPLRERRRHRKEEKERQKQEAGKQAESWPERMLGRGSPRVTFAVGVVLSFPGVSYLSALHRIAELDYATVATALLVLAVALIQQLLLEVPLLGYAFAPERTERAVKGFRAWLARSGRRAAAIGAAAIGALLVVRGLIELLA
jgi:Sap, sulfolipid-1-addressing protein